MLHMPQGDRSRGPISELAQDQDDQRGIGELVNFALDLLRRQYVLILFVTVLGVAASLHLPADDAADLHRSGQDFFSEIPNPSSVSSNPS